MNSVAAKTTIFLGLLSTAIFAQDLGKGHFELRASGGIIDAGNGPFRSALPSYELEAAFGLSRFFAVTGGYTHDYLRDTGFTFCALPGFVLPGQVVNPSDCNQLEFQNRFQEFMGGVRFSVPNHSPITPHLQFSMGAVRQTSDPFPTNLPFSIPLTLGISYEYRQNRIWNCGGCGPRLQTQSSLWSWRRWKLCEGESNYGFLSRHGRRVLSVLMESLWSRLFRASSIFERHSDPGPKDFGKGDILIVGRERRDWSQRRRSSQFFASDCWRNNLIQNFMNLLVGNRTWRDSPHDLLHSRRKLNSAYLFARPVIHYHFDPWTHGESFSIQWYTVLGSQSVCVDS